MTDEQAHLIANLAIAARHAQLALEAEEGNWQPGHLDRLRTAYMVRDRKRDEFYQAVKDYEARAA